MATYKVMLNIGRTDIREGSKITSEELKKRAPNETEADLVNRGILVVADEKGKPKAEVTGRGKQPELTGGK